MSADFQAYKVVNNETSSASKFDSFVQASENALNGLGGSGTAFASGLVVPSDQLTQNGAASGQALVWNGSAWAPTTLSGVYFKDTAAVDVTGTTTLTDLFNGAGSISAGTMGTDKKIRATLYGDYLNNSGAGRTLRVQASFGGVTFMEDIIGDGAGGIAASATRRPFKFVVEIMNLGAADQQWGHMDISLGGVGGATAGIGELGEMNGNNAEAAQYGNMATDGVISGLVDTTAVKAFAVKVQHSNNAGTISCRCKYRSIEVVG